MMVTLRILAIDKRFIRATIRWYKLVLWRTISPFKQMTTWDSIFKG
jgi:hypothetical protein